MGRRGGKPEITQDEVDLAESIAHSVARTTVGKLAGADELVSQSLVALHLRYRLIDWLRSEYGRVSRGVAPPKLVAALTASSIDEHPDVEPRIDPSEAPPSVEETVMARDQLYRLGSFLRTLSEVDRRSLLWPVDGSSAEEVAKDLGRSKSTMAAARMRAKEVAAEAIDWPLTKRVYSARREDFNHEKRQDDETRHEDSRATATPSGGAPVCVLDPGEERGARGMLPVDGSDRPGRLRATRQGVAGAPVGVRAAGGPDPRGHGTGPHLSGAVLREPGAPGAGDAPGERPAGDAVSDTHRKVCERPRPQRDASVVAGISQTALDAAILRVQDESETGNVVIVGRPQMVNSGGCPKRAPHVTPPSLLFGRNGARVSRANTHRNVGLIGLRCAPLAVPVQQ